MIDNIIIVGGWGMDGGALKYLDGPLVCSESGNRNVRVVWFNFHILPTEETGKE